MYIQKHITIGSRRKIKGVGLIEVLVALVVVSFGVLGMASLQLTGMKHSSGGFNRSKAMLFAQSMATRIRLNPAAVTPSDDESEPADAVKFAYAAFDSKGINCATLPEPYCQSRKGVNDTPSCTTAQLAAFDLYSVSCGDGGPNGGGDKGVVGTLPNGNITTVCLDKPCKVDSAYQVTVTWSEGRSRSNSGELVSRRVQVRLKP